MNLAFLGATALAVAGLGFVVMVRAPRLALCAWLAGVCFVPVWAGVTAVIDWEPHVLVSIALALSLVVAVLAGRGQGTVRLTWADGIFVVFMLTALLGAIAGRERVTDVFVLLVQWNCAYVAGRLVAHRVPLAWVYGAIAVAFTVVAVLALLEFFTHWNPFVGVPGSGNLYDAWSPIQERGGRSRAEGAFGHSIALGASLAIAVPITLAAPFRSGLRIGMVVLMLAASVVTFSRIGLLTAIAGVGLVVLCLRSELSSRMRWTVVGGLAVVGAAASSLLSGVFEAAGSEATESADYRVQLLRLVSGLRPFGLSADSVQTPDGHHFFGTFTSIDNALLLLALCYGWVPLVLMVLLLATAVWCLLSGRVTAPTIAVVAQLPALVTVALITQYSTVLWFVAGLAAFSQSVAARRRVPTRTDHSARVRPLPDGMASDRSPVLVSPTGG